jgi:tetratricopeptide (TPR) repeat protein
MKHQALAATLALALLVRPLPSRAQTRGAESAGAETLFQQGVALMNDGRVEQACSKFEGSQSLDPALGTLLRLGDCYDRLGKTASAWTTFQDAVSLARNRKEAERQQIGSERVADLERRLSWVQLTLATGQSQRDLSLRIDGRAVSLALLESPIPFDPGAHQLELSAPGRHGWTGSIEVTPGPSRQTLELPQLELEASPSMPPAVPKMSSREPARRGGDRRPWGIVIGSAGLLGLGVGGVLSYQALRVNDDARSECNSHNLCSARGVEQRNSAIGYANGATVAVVAGGVLLAGGLGLVLWGSSEEAPETEVSAALSPEVGSVQIGGRF